MLKDYCYMTTMNYIGTYMLSALIIRTSYNTGFTRILIFDFLGFWIIIGPDLMMDYRNAAARCYLKARGESGYIWELYRRELG